MTTPDVIGLGNGTAVLHGQALAETSRLISWAVKELRRRDGIHAPRLTRLEAVLRTEAAASLTVNGHAVGPTDGAVVAFRTDLITTEEVAPIMRLSERQIRRRAVELGGRQVAGRWLFDPVIVAAAAAQNPEKEGPR
jgi:hypothetical protein